MRDRPSQPTKAGGTMGFRIAPVPPIAAIPFSSNGKIWLYNPITGEFLDAEACRVAFLEPDPADELPPGVPVAPNVPPEEPSA